VKSGRVIGTVDARAAHSVTTVTVTAAVASLTRAYQQALGLAVVKRFAPTIQPPAALNA